MGLEVEVQPYIGKKWFDFKVGNTLIELDGPQYHGDEKDDIKNALAKKYGFNILRIKVKELEHTYTLKNKLKKCLLKAQ